jgi:hypothetical protein
MVIFVLSRNFILGSQVSIGDIGTKASVEVLLAKTRKSKLGIQSRMVTRDDP